MEPAYGEQDIVLIVSVRCMFMHACLHPSRFVQATTSTFMHGYQNNLVQFFSLVRRNAI